MKQSFDARIGISHKSLNRNQLEAPIRAFPGSELAFGNNKTHYRKHDWSAKHRGWSALARNKLIV